MIAVIKALRAYRLTAAESYLPHQNQSLRDANILEYIFPKHCMDSHNADMGELVSQVYLQCYLYVSALKSLTPTIIGIEMALRFVTLF